MSTTFFTASYVNRGNLFYDSLLFIRDYLWISIQSFAVTIRPQRCQLMENYLSPCSDLFHWRQDHTISVCSESSELRWQTLIDEFFHLHPIQSKVHSVQKKKTRISVKSILPKYSYILIKHMRTNSLRIKELSLLTISDLYYKYKLVPLNIARKLEYSLESNGLWPPPSWARQSPRWSF